MGQDGFRTSAPVVDNLKPRACCKEDRARASQACVIVRTAESTEGLHRKFRGIPRKSTAAARTDPVAVPPPDEIAHLPWIGGLQAVGYNNPQTQGGLP